MVVVWSVAFVSFSAAILLTGGAAVAEIVEYSLTANHVVINADGTFLRKALFNGSLPGPPIRCTVGDTLKIQVVNELNKEELSVHFQGQTSLPNVMDGAPYITEIPIAPNGGTRTYEFVAEKPGTFHYHSTQGFNKMTLHGMLIVEDDDSGNQNTSYDAELLDVRTGYPGIMAADFYHSAPSDLEAQLDNNLGDWIWAPQSVLINGWGWHNCSIPTENPYYYGCTWQCPADDVDCIDEVRCSNAVHPLTELPLGPYIWEERGTNALYDALVASDPTLYTEQVQTNWSINCGWDHIAPSVVGTEFERTADGRIIGESGERHQSQFLNWGRPTGLDCRFGIVNETGDVGNGTMDSRCLSDGTWPFKGYNDRTYDHLRDPSTGVYDVTYFDNEDSAAHNALCRATRMLTGDYQPESNHYPYGLWSQSRQDCNTYGHEVQKNSSPPIFEVEAGKTYRLRIVNAATMLLPTLVIEGHVMTVIEVDGNYVEPFVTSFLDAWNGQSYSVLLTANASTPGDFWIGLSPRLRGSMRLDPGRAILRYVAPTINGTLLPMANATLPGNGTRPVPKWWDAASIGNFGSERAPVACPVELYSTLQDGNRSLEACPGFYPNVADQNISMELQYKMLTRDGNDKLPETTMDMVSVVSSMNANGFSSFENYTTCTDDFGDSGISGTVINAFSYSATWRPRYSRFQPHTILAGSQELCGSQRWSINNITYSRKNPSSYVSSQPAGYSQPLLQHVYEGTFGDIPNVFDVKRPGTTKFFEPFDWYETWNSSVLGGGNKEQQGVYPSSHEFVNVMKFPDGAVVDVVMQNTVTLRFWTNALYGDKHTHREGSEQLPFQTHGMEAWIIGYGEANFNESAWSSVENVEKDAPVEYNNGIIWYKNTVNPAKRSLAVNFAGGWTVLRVHTKNPGLWLFHCTVSARWHMGLGMIIGVGLGELSGEASPFIASTSASECSETDCSGVCNTTDKPPGDGDNCTEPPMEAEDHKDNGMVALGIGLGIPLLIALVIIVYYRLSWERRLKEEVEKEYSALLAAKTVHATGKSAGAAPVLEEIEEFGEVKAKTLEKPTERVEMPRRLPVDPDMENALRVHDENFLETA